MIQHSHIPRVLQLAARVEQDIRSRELRPGDAYLNAQEVAQMLGVTKALANRAMQLLAKRHVLHRGQHRGVVIAEGIVSTKRPPVRCVHFLVQKNFLKTEGILVDGVLVGMQEELPDTDVRLNFLPPGDELDGVNRLIAAAARSSEPHEIGVHLGRFLARQAQGQPCDPDHEVIPVVLEVPEKKEAGGANGEGREGGH